jgi:hypothetical protein
VKPADHAATNDAKTVCHEGAFLNGAKPKELFEQEATVKTETQIFSVTSVASCSILCF